jgi:hypothetical protein
MLRNKGILVLAHSFASLIFLASVLLHDNGATDDIREEVAIALATNASVTDFRYVVVCHIFALLTLIFLQA